MGSMVLGTNYLSFLQNLLRFWRARIHCPALLEADGKTYSLRQKNTSNALIILRPVDEIAQDSNATSGVCTETGMRAIASVHETVELLPENGPVPAAAKPKGKWHEKFGRTR
ncbi:hypothetical protein MCOR27_010474 [Pyricularia oryzae]|uniref:Uncharacterized protein n=1 Tax=Pyricularia grisea TaxID=148305 RepID=A0ABQ8N8Q7_PYRGI|nr:hypothetical protein MCOR01_008339 [Pyricularia oryzae]KAI6292309.1 hypothetical protein MCOR33_009961 [Pyricularia grisea]KAH9438950.1 hypothetical protein MCOR02_002538 [Pyricularia oryzae]KAI6253250.1 hypothetical protein MCOR19_010185 [Pyricularia oryzae]KAI6267716.1 hypothetical protein MCOR27_010474 [Pyricularia oryzae]